MDIFDLHCDALSYAVKSESEAKNVLKELESGPLKTVFLAAYSGSNTDKEEFLSQIKIFENFRKTDKFKAVLTVENIGFTSGNESEIAVLKKLGAAAVTLTHNTENRLAYANSFDRDIHLKGLKEKGVLAVEFLDSLGVTLDVSHLNMGGFYDVSRICRRPIIASHSCCNTLFFHPRNLYDSQLRIIARSGGIIGICLYSHFLNGTDSMNATDVVNQARHIAKVAGIDAVSLGSDFYGMQNKNGLNRPADFSLLLDSLNRYFSADECEKICYKNAERVFTC